MLLVSILDKGKRLISALSFFIILSMIMTGCVDLHAGKRPFDYPNSVWVCEDPYIYIVVDEHKITESYLRIGDELQQFDLCFDFGRGVDALKLDIAVVEEESFLFQGECEFGKDRFTITLTKDNLWNWKYQKLTFVRRTGDGLRETS